MIRYASFNDIINNEFELPIFEYTYERKHEKIVGGKYRGIEFKIMNYGTHPCSYILLTDEQARTLGYEDSEDDLNCLICHGGCTYGCDVDPETKKETPGYIWAGWDYAHLGDFHGSDLNPLFLSIKRDGHKYTTKELVLECFETIDYTLADLRKEKHND